MGLGMYVILSIVFLFGVALAQNQIALIVIDVIAALFVALFLYEIITSRKKKAKAISPLELEAEFQEYYKEQEKPKKKKEKAPKELDSKHVQKDRFFSEAHPGAYGLAKSLLPRLHLLIIVGFILYKMYWELITGNSDFMLDWYNASPLPAFFQVISSKESLQLWMNQYGLVFSLVIIIIIIVLVTFYYTFWRLAFKDYYKFSEGSRRYEGRCYWRNNNGPTQWFDKHYGSPKREKNTYFLKIGWWPPLSLINPPNSLVKLDTTLGEKCERRGVYVISVSEYPLRHKVGNDPKHWETLPGQYANGEIPNEYATKYFAERSKVTVNDTTDLSFANADTRNSVMRDGLRLSKESIRRHIVTERERKQNNSGPSG